MRKRKIVAAASFVVSLLCVVAAASLSRSSTAIKARSVWEMNLYRGDAGAIFVYGESHTEDLRGTFYPIEVDFVSPPERSSKFYTRVEFKIETGIDEDGKRRDVKWYDVQHAFMDHWGIWLLTVPTTNLQTSCIAIRASWSLLLCAAVLALPTMYCFVHAAFVRLRSRQRRLQNECVGCKYPLNSNQCSECGLIANKPASSGKG